MKRLVYGEDARCITWAEETMPGCKFREDAKSIAIARDDELLAAAVFDTFSRTSCFLHLVSDGSKHFLNRAFIVHVFAYPFITCGYRRVSAMAAESNARSIKLVQHFGFVQEGRLREDTDDGSDLIVFGMLRSECRWLPATTGFLSAFTV